MANAGRSSDIIPIWGKFPAESQVIEGMVNANLEAVVTLFLRGPEGQTQQVDAVIDTGFNGYLALPPMLVADLELPIVGDGEAVLADGREVSFNVYGVTALWDGLPRYVETGAVGDEPLVGMSMLVGYDLHVKVANGGRVTIGVMEAT